MRALAYFILLGMLGTGASLASGGSASPSPKAAHPKPKVIDLDFSDDDDDVPMRHAPPQVQSAATPGKWIYWTVGATAVAGGVGWYLYRDQAKTTTVTRKEQIFTDERP